MSRPLWIQSLLLLKFIASSESNPIIAAAIEHAPVSAVVNTVDYPRYAYSYAVIDPHTNDKKAHWETREGNEVNGAYSLVEPDGNIRIVEYNANDVKGFTAVVKKLGPNVHPTQIVQAVPLILNPAPHPRVVAEPVHQPEAVPIVLPPVHHPSPAKVEVAEVQTEHRVEEPNSLAYGLGAVALPIEVPEVVFEKGSLPWDPRTGSYGGWRPLPGPQAKQAYATIYSRKYIDGHLHKIVTGPISLVGKTLYIRKTHN
ncbi:cuticle protein 18.6-like [Colias croceus]|uniref:cuticle protein 18.6-like n=1 Tax=Colias crocea TaxID=72248 RepID=UPI001E281907|nr:cuticle protein 18.6-like [Colias croceus]